MAYEPTTVLDRVDLKEGVAYYKVFKPVQTTIYTTVTNFITHTLRTIYTIATAVNRTYLLPDGNPYTVLRIPTTITVGSKVITETPLKVSV